MKNGMDIFTLAAELGQEVTTTVEQQQKIILNEHAFVTQDPATGSFSYVFVWNNVSAEYIKAIFDNPENL